MSLNCRCAAPTVSRTTTSSISATWCRRPRPRCCGRRTSGASRSTRSRKCSPAWACGSAWTSPAGRRRISRKWRRSSSRKCWAKRRFARSGTSSEVRNKEGPLRWGGPFPLLGTGGFRPEADILTIGHLLREFDFPSPHFHAPLIVHIHGLFALSWIVLFATQSVLVGRGATKIHMRLGIVGLPIAAGVLVTGMMVAHWTVVRDLPTRGSAALSGIVGVFTSLFLFLAFASAALVMRRKPDWHKRLMLLATLI